MSVTPTQKYIPIDFRVGVTPDVTMTFVAPTPGILYIYLDLITPEAHIAFQPSRYDRAYYDCQRAREAHNGSWLLQHQFFFALWVRIRVRERVLKP